MSLTAAGFIAHCDHPEPCEAQVQLPYRKEADALKTLMGQFRWRRVNLDGAVIVLCPRCVAKEIERRKGPLDYV